MQWFNLVSGFLTANLQAVLLTICGLFLIVTILFFVLNARLAKLIKRYNAMMAGMDGRNLEDTLMAHIESVRAVVERMNELELNQKKQKLILEDCLQHVGMVRYNAFPDVGSDLSFSLALMDSGQNGVVLTGIFNRELSQTYAKPITKGASNYVLSPEESEAIRRALEKKKEG